MLYFYCYYCCDDDDRCNDDDYNDDDDDDYYYNIRIFILYTYTHTIVLLQVHECISNSVAVNYMETSD